MRWSLILQGYDIRIEHLKGQLNFTDFLSRAFQCQNAIVNVNHIEKINVLPAERKETLEKAHIATGHGGKGAMKYFCTNKYYWKGMEREISEYVKNCATCKRSSGKNKFKSCIPIQANYKNQLWNIDTIGPINTSRKGFRFIFTVIDGFSRRGAAFTAKSKEKTETIGIIMKLIDSWGVPKKY